MPLYFNKRRHWPPSRPIQFILAFLALLLAVVILVAWLMIGYHQSAPKPEQEPDTSSTTQQETIMDIGRCLVILDVEEKQHFILVQTNPATPQVSIMHIPQNLAVENSTLKEVFKKHGSPRAVQVLSEALQLPVSHYLTLNGKGIENFVNQFENGIVYTLPEKISYTDENDIRIHLDAKEHTLTGGQVKEILRYDGWNKSTYRAKIAPELLCALINQYMREEFPLRAYFGLLSNDAVSDLRIDNFNAYHTALTQIARGNNGDVCKISKLTGNTSNGKFAPDIADLQKSSPFYR